MHDLALQTAVAAVPAGRWAVGVSGGADSVAMLLLLHARCDLSLHVVHLDHQTRGGESHNDARFVGELACRLGLPCTVALRSDVEASMGALAANASSRYRAARLELFGRVVARERLAGILLAHHADDRAETVLLRLLRGSGPMGLAPLEPESCLGDLRIVRPLLSVDRSRLRQFLAERQQTWREDASNASEDYLRNRLRPLLNDRPTLKADLLALADACREVRDWTRVTAPTLAPSFRRSELCGLAPMVAAESARRWLAERGAPPDKLLPEVIDRLIHLCVDAASSPRAHFPGQLLVARRAGVICVDPPEGRELKPREAKC